MVCYYKKHIPRRKMKLDRMIKSQIYYTQDICNSNRVLIAFFDSIMYTVSKNVSDKHR